jgi:hypothetical protein
MVSKSGRPIPGHSHALSAPDFPMHLRTSRWFNDSIAIERGPLIFSYGVGEDWVKLRGNGLDSADWQVFPTTPWNYALKVDTGASEAAIAVSEMPVGQRPFSREHAPVRLRVKGRQMPSWRADGRRVPFQVNSQKRS